jgi:hypothetical protein
MVIAFYDFAYAYPVDEVFHIEFSRRLPGKIIIERDDKEQVNAERFDETLPLFKACQELNRTGFPPHDFTRVRLECHNDASTPPGLCPGDYLTNDFLMCTMNSVERTNRDNRIPILLNFPELERYLHTS